MALSYDLISQFAKQVAKNDRKTKTESTVYGTVVTDGNGDKYVKIDGSDQLTPLGDTSANVNKDERVSVLIKNHTATVTGNISSPAARTGDVESIGDQVSEIQKFDILIGGRIEANEGYIKQLQADTADIGELRAATAEIGELVAKKADIEELNAAKATIEDLKSTKIDAEIVNAQFATIENLNATTARVGTIEGDYAAFKQATVDDLSAIDANITNLDTTKLTASQADIRYANIDFANIGKAAMEHFYASSGLIKDVVVGDQTITGHLVGVTITGDLIEGNTIKAEKLVVKGTDGLYYKLNTDGMKVEAQQTDENSLNGSIITAKSITATKVNVSDLIAFDATIAGLHMKDFETHQAIYSGTKESVSNTTRGFYMDSIGQLALGDSNNYIKYFKDTDGTYKLIISAVDKLELGGRNLLIGTSTGDGWKYGSFNRDTNTFTIQNGSNIISDTILEVYSSRASTSGTTLNISDISSTVSETTLTVGGTTKEIFIQNINSPISLEANREYTLSFYAKRSNNGRTMDVYVIDADTDHAEYVILGKTNILSATNSFVKFEYTFMPSAVHSASAVVRFDLNSGSGATTTLSVKDIKLEVGNKPSAWTPAPEDLEWKARDADGKVREFVTEQSTSVVKTCEGIIQTASKEYVSTTEYGQYKIDVDSQLNQIPGEIKAVFSKTETLINGEGGVGDRISKLEKHIVMDQDGILIYAKENGEHCKLRLRLDNDMICFESIGEKDPIAWWDGYTLHTGNIEVETYQRAQFGNFAFIPFKDGSLKFLKVK